ncbi:CaiB/BaiF CoA-transferase family protein [Actinoplanes sp. NPDC051411]|uniref:CaiB/BaiF CoA transferase family protein n=1 Tax=Actinoplanes sp. NPDC051411 TaxID=3155522 RepID=UPI00342C68D7
MTNASGPLTGLRVLELGSFIAAPTAGRLLADFGAEVVKVERPGTGDELRRWRLHGGDTSLLFRTLNRNKRSIAIDLRAPAGRDLALGLAARSDVVLENFRPGTLERWGLGPDEIRKANPRAVLVRISGYGQTGPYRDRPGFGGVAEAIGGLREVTGYPDRPPTRAGISLADSVAALYAVIGALMALRNNDTEVVDVALYEGIYSLMESLVPDYEVFGVQPRRSGSGLPGVAPSGTYRCADDGWAVISGNGDAIFRRLMLLAGRADLAQHPELGDNAGRVAHQGEIDAAIEAWTGQHPLDEVLTALDRAGVPAGPIYTAADIAKDPHYAARGMLESHPVGAGTASFPGIVPRLEHNPGGTRWLGPDLGADTDHILDDLGIEASRKDALRQQGVIG